MDKFFSSHVAMYVDKGRGETPLPVLLVRWDFPTEPGYGDGNRIWMETLRSATRAEPTKRTEFHKWQPRAWWTENILVQFCYKDAPQDDFLTCHIQSPVFWRRALMQFPVIRSEIPELKERIERDDPPALIQDAIISGAAQWWFPWLAAWQETKYFVMLPGIYDRKNPSRWIPLWDQGLTFIIPEFQLTQIGERAELDRLTRLARQQL